MFLLSLQDQKKKKNQPKSSYLVKEFEFFSTVRFVWNFMSFNFSKDNFTTAHKSFPIREKKNSKYATLLEEK